MDILEIVMLNKVCRTISTKTTVSYHNAHCGPTNLPFLQSALISHTPQPTLLAIALCWLPLISVHVMYTLIAMTSKNRKC